MPAEGRLPRRRLSRNRLWALAPLALAPLALAPLFALLVRRAWKGELRLLRFRLRLGDLPPPPAGAWGAALGRGNHPEPEPHSRLERALHDHLRGQGTELSSGHRFDGLLVFPGSAQDSGPYEQLASAIRRARREVLLANMVWDAGPHAPGAVLVAALAELRQRVNRHPEQYPQGMKVRLLLGNSNRFDSLLDPTTNLYNAAAHLLAAGLLPAQQAASQNSQTSQTSQNGAGWDLQVANYRYAFPHSHMKLLVIDREQVTAGGFNISTMHLPRAQGGLGLRDLALSVSGPVARHAAAAFADAWNTSQVLTCSPAATPQTVRAACDLRRPTAPEWPLWPDPPRPLGTARVYPLYRRQGQTQADQALVALVAASRRSLDLLQSQISGDLLGDLLGLLPGGSAYPRHALPVWRAVVGAMQTHQVQVRLLLDRTPLLHAEGLGLLRGLLPELRASGVAHLFQARWAADQGRVGTHAKALLIDQEVAVIGSHNLHFSSFGPHGLSEYSLATSDPQAVAALQQVFEEEWALGQPCRLPWWHRR